MKNYIENIIANNPLFVDLACKYWERNAPQKGEDSKAYYKACCEAMNAMRVEVAEACLGLDEEVAERAYDVLVKHQPDDMATALYFGDETESLKHYMFDEPKEDYSDEPGYYESGEYEADIAAGRIVVESQWNDTEVVEDDLPF